MRFIFVPFFFIAATALAQAPVADFDWTPEDPAPGTSIEFRDRSTGATSSTFFLGMHGGTPFPGPVLQLSFANPGTYQLRLEARNSSGSSTKLRRVNVGVAATSSFTKSASTVNTGQAVQFTDQSSGLVRSWSWSFGDGTTRSEDSPQHAWSAPGTYTVTLEVRYTSGSIRTSQTVTVLPTATRPAANFTFTPPAPRRGDTVQFTDTSTGSPTSWNWSFGDGTTSTQRSPSHVYAQAGTYSVALTASNSSGSDTATKTIGVTGDPNAGPKADFAFTDYPLVGQPVQFTDRTTGSPNGWSWTFGDGGTSTQQSPSYVFRAAGVYTVGLAARNATGSDLTTERITVRSGEPIEADFETFPSQIVKGEPILFVNRSTGPVVSATWTFPGGTTSTESSVTHTFPETGEPTIDLTVTDGVQMKKMTRRMTVREKARRVPVAHFAAPGSAMIREVVDFENLSSPDATTFRWDFGDGSTDTGRQARHSYTNEGTYRVTLVARSSEGEEATARREIQIDDPNSVKADFTWSPLHPVEGMEVQFLNKSDDRAIEFLWSGPVETRSNERHIRYRFRNGFVGTFDVTLTATTASGVTNTIVKSVSVKPATELVARLECKGGNREYLRGDYGKGDCGTDYEIYRQYNCVAQVTGKPTTAEIRINGVVFTIKVGDSEVPFPISDVPAYFGASVDPGKEATLELIAYREADKAVAGQSLRLTGPCFACSVDRGYRPVIVSCPEEEEDALQADFVVRPAVPKVGEEVTLFDASKGGPRAFTWTVGDKVLNGFSVQHRFLTAGRHVIRHEVSNGSDVDFVSRAVEVKGGAGPEFKKVTSRYGECYYNNYPVDIEVNAEMDWKESTPVSAKFRINDGAERPAEIDAALNIKLSFRSGELRKNPTSDRNVITIIALNAAGISTSYELPLYAIEAGPLLRRPALLRESNRYTFNDVIKLPPAPLKGKLALGEIREAWKGKEIGLEETQVTFQRVLGTDCTTEASLTGMTGFDLLYFDIRGEVHGKHTVTVAPATGINDQGGLIGVEIGGGGSGPEMSLLTWVPALQPFCIIPRVCEMVKVKEELFLKAGLDLRFYRVKQETSPGVVEESWAFDDVDFLIKPEGKLALSAKLSDSVGIELSAATSFQTKFKFVRPPYINGAELKFTGSAKASLLLYELEHQISLTCTFAPTGGSWNCASQGLLSRSGDPMSSHSSRQPLALRPIPIAGEREQLAFKMRQRGDAIVATSLSKLAAPAAAETGGSVVAAYVSENPSAPNPLHRTDLRFVTRQDGAWSEPRAITGDALGDFSPSLVKASDGRLLALWQRIKNPSLRLEDVQTSADLPKLYREIEIVSSVYASASGTWSAPVALTDNQVFDHDPIALALSDGRVLALWFRDPGNDLAGTPANPTQLVTRTWNGTEWGAETIVANGLTGVEGLHGSSRTTSATATFSRDKDGDAATSNDREIAVISYDNSTWGSLRDLTADSISDRAPRVAYGSDGARVLWISGDSLVWQLLGGQRQVIRQGSSGSLLNATVAAAPAGNLFVVWTESIAGSADVIIRSYDPATKVWSDDIPLTRNDAVESSLSAFFTPDGKLQVVGLETETKYVSETRIIDGQPVIFPNVPKPGAIQLLHLEKDIVVDVAIGPNTLTTSAGTPAAGETVTLTAELFNAGDLPVRDVPLVVYSGRGTGGEVLARDRVAGDWNAGSPRNVQISFPYSSKAEEITLAVDPLGESGDRLQANNSAVFSYRNAPPVACVQVSRMIGLAPLTVTFDANCSSDSDGRVVLTRWSLADGVAATGTVATHVFSSPGTYTITATVIDDLGRAATSTVDIYVSSLGDPRGSRPANAPLILPVVGRTAGVGGTFFVSDSMIFNSDADRDLVVQATFFPDGRRDFHYAKLTVPPNRLLDLRDLVAKTFHASGVGWARFDVSHPNAVITSRTYNNQPTGTAGTFIPASTAADAVAPGLKRVFLQEWREGYRVNVGLTEIGGDGGMVSVSLYDENGTLAGTKQYAVAPWQRLQVNGEPLFQSKGRIEITTDGGKILAFTTTTDNKSGDPVYQAGVEMTSLPPSTRWLVPIVGRVRGAFDTDFRSDVRVFNPTESTQNVRFTLTLTDRAIEKSVAVESGKTAAFDDIISGLFPELSGGAVGSLTIAADGAVVVTAKTYNQTSKGTYGVATPPRLTDRLLGAGQRGDLIQLRNDSAFRCNFGATAGPDGTELLIAAYNESGNLLGERSLAVAPKQNIQIGRIFESLGVTTPLAAARLNVAVISGSAYVFATVVDNQTGDGTFVEAGK